MPKISIIMPTYNRSSFINRAILSVINQIFTDWELIIVDDGSTDNTVSIVNEFIKKDERIKLFKTSKNSGGPATPRNIGIENAKGEYVAFLDSDDEWMPEKLEKQFKFFESSSKKKLGIISCFAYTKENSTNRIISMNNNFKKHSNDLGYMLKKCFILSTSCVMTKLSILKEVGQFDTNLRNGEDWDMWIRMLEVGYEFDITPEYLINYFIHKGNISNDTNISNKDLHFICEKHKELFIQYSLFLLAYSYFMIKNYKTARKYFIDVIFSKKSNSKEKIKSFIYIIISLFPRCELSLQKTGSKITKLFNH